MLNFIKKMIEDKKEYKEQMQRAENLPEDYKFVFEKIHGYIWGFAAGDGSDMIKVQGQLIEFFEISSAEGKHVLEVTGEDVASFCDELLSNAKKWTDKYGEKLNCEIKNKIEK